MKNEGKSAGNRLSRTASVLVGMVSALVLSACVSPRTEIPLITKDAIHWKKPTSMPAAA